MLAIATAVKIVLGALVSQCIYYRYLHPLSAYPGPFLASFSDLWKFLTFFRGEHHLVEQKLHEKHGRVVRTGPNSLSFSGLSDFDAIYGFNKFIEKGDFYDFSRDNRLVENVFSSRTDASHREHRRKVVAPALSSAKVATYNPIIAKNVDILLSRIRALLEDGSAIDIAKVMHRFAFDTMVEVIYGETICPRAYSDSKASAGILAAFREMSKFAWGPSLLPWFGWLMNTRPVIYLIRRPTTDSDGNLNGLGALVFHTQKLVLKQPDQALKSAQPSIVKNYLSVPPDHTNHMPPYQIWRESFNLTFAGPGSTAAALTAVLYRLGTREGRPWQTRIRIEQKSITGGAASSSLSFIPPILLAIIKETLRLNAPFPTAFPRVITPGAELAIPSLQTPLPVGTIVSANTYVLGHSKSIWGAEAEVWQPERWINVQGESEKGELDEKFVAFSKGARGCIGKEIAMLVISKAVVAVLEKWDLASVGLLKGKSFLEMQYEECVIKFTRAKE